MTHIVEASYELGYYPSRWKEATVCVLRKPGKTVNDQKEAGAYRPVVLLNTAGKIMEVLIALKLSEAVERARTLPKLQMGFRAKRLTDLVIRVVTDTVHKSWS